MIAGVALEVEVVLVVGFGRAELGRLHENLIAGQQGRRAQQFCHQPGQPLIQHKCLKFALFQKWAVNLARRDLTICRLIDDIAFTVTAQFLLTHFVRDLGNPVGFFAAEDPLFDCPSLLPIMLVSFWLHGDLP